MKKTDFTNEASGLVVKGQRGDQRVNDPKRIRMLLAVMFVTTAGNQGISRKTV